MLCSTMSPEAKMNLSTGHAESWGFRSFLSENHLMARHCFALSSCSPLWTTVRYEILDHDQVPTPRPSGKSVDPRTVREWAQSNGYEVSPRGRISRSVMDVYLASR
jgi:hypothetical protein